jgi:hypothetical protein
MAIQAPKLASRDIVELQREIDAARDSAIIHLPAGVIRGCLVIDKPIVLRGRGPDETTLDGWGKGPVLSIDVKGEVRIEELTITGGRAGMGGAIAIDNGATVFVSGCLIQRNSARLGRGGAIAVDHGRLHVRECTIVDNRAQLGGAIFVGGRARCEISASILANNDATRGGAFAAIDDAEVEVWTSRFEHNRAESEGAHVYTYGTLTRAPRIAITNTLVGETDEGSLPIANHRVRKASVVIEDSSVAREHVPSMVVG